MSALERMPSFALLALLLAYSIPAQGQFRDLEQLGLSDRTITSLAVAEGGSLIAATPGPLYAYTGESDWVEIDDPLFGARLLATPNGDIFGAGRIEQVDTFRIMRSKTAGLSWSELYRHATRDPVYGDGDYVRVMDFARGTDGTLGVLTATLQTPAVNYGQLHISDDGGETWTSVSVPYGQSAAFAADGGLLVGTDYGSIWRSEDEGVTWNYVHDTRAREVVGMVADSDGLMYAIAKGVDGGLFVSSDDGRSWVREPSVHGTFVALFADQQANVLALHSSGKLYTLFGGGLHLSAEVDIETLGVRVATLDDRGRLLLGTHDRGVFRTTESIATAIQNAEGIYPGLRMHVFPNPANTWMNLEIAAETPAVVTIEVVDLLGRHRVVLHYGYLSSGVHRIDYDVSGLESGSYYIKATMYDAVLTRKVVIVR